MLNIEMEVSRMTIKELKHEIAEAMREGCGVADLEYVEQIASRLMSKEPTQKQIDEVLGNLKMGLGVQNAFILIESF